MKETTALVIAITLAMCTIIVVEYIEVIEKVELAKLGYEQARLDGVTIWIKKSYLE